MTRRNRAARSRDTIPSDTSNLRIIAGVWRGRKIPFIPVEGLRPTPDRVRETLFNWLQTSIPGANCLDLCCGSGALGFEALSRGAAAVTFVDQSSIVVQQIKQNLQLLKAQNGAVLHQDALQWLESRLKDQEARYDLVFLDPPFRKGLIKPMLQLLETKNLLNTGALVYVEAESEWIPDIATTPWQLYREKVAGQVAYRLYLFSNPEVD